MSELTEQQIATLYHAQSRLYGMRWDEAYAFARAVEKAVREECAKVCDEVAAEFMRSAPGTGDARYDWQSEGAEHCAAEIRSGGSS